MTNSLTIHEITNEMSTLLWHNIMNMISFYFKSSFLEKKYWLVPNTLGPRTVLPRLVLSSE